MENIVWNFTGIAGQIMPACELSAFQKAEIASSIGNAAIQGWIWGFITCFVCWSFVYYMYFRGKK